MRAELLSRILRAAAVLVVVSGGLLLGPAAGAEPRVTFVDCPEASPSPEPSPTPTPSSSSCTPAEGSTIRGDATIVFEVSTESLEDLTRVTVSVLSDGDPDAPDAANPVRVWENPDGLDQERFEHLWRTTSTPADNGRYKVRVEAVAEGVDGTTRTDTAERTGYRVDNPPQRPPKPRVTGVDEGEGVVSIEWSEAPEPDVLNYTLYRARTESADEKPDDGAFKARVVTEKLSTLDEVTKAGAYWYKVETTRRSVVTPDEGISSERSARSDEPGVYAPPTPTPAPTPPPDEGGTTNGGETSDATPRPQLTPRPLPRAERSGPPLPSDAPYSDVLPYDLPEEGNGSGSGGADLAQRAERDVREPGDDRQGPLPAVAIGMFLVSAALALGRLPTA